MAYQTGLVILAAAISGTFYRLGGAGKKGTCLDFARQSKVRDVGCSLVLLCLVGLLTSFKWPMLLTFGLSWAALSTYWDSVFGYDNFYMHGLGCGLAAIPLYWCGLAWWIIAIRIVICTIGMGVWSKHVDNDVLEEVGRGVFFIL